MQRHIEGIETHFAQSLLDHEIDFVQAYKCQMLKIQNEMVFLKDKQQELMQKLMRDDRITNLQSEIMWFKSESTKLNQMLELQKREI